MKKKIFHYLLFAISLASCDTMTTEIEGKWQLSKMESDGIVTKVDTVWYNFQTTLFKYQIYDKKSDTYSSCNGLCILENEKLSLVLVSDPVPAEQFIISTDWSSPSREFFIEKKKHNDLVLSSEGKTYYFRKF